MWKGLQNHLFYLFMLVLWPYGPRNTYYIRKSMLIRRFINSFLNSWLVEGWKRNQSTRSMKWGSTGYEDEEIERVEFNGVMTKSPIDGKPILYQPYEDIYRTRIFIYVKLYCK